MTWVPRCQWKVTRSRGEDAAQTLVQSSYPWPSPQPMPPRTARHHSSSCTRHLMHTQQEPLNSLTQRSVWCAPSWFTGVHTPLTFADVHVCSNRIYDCSTNPTKFQVNQSWKNTVGKLEVKWCMDHSCPAAGESQTTLGCSELEEINESLCITQVCEHCSSTDSTLFH